MNLNIPKLFTTLEMFQPICECDETPFETIERNSSEKLGKIIYLNG